MSKREPYSTTIDSYLKDELVNLSNITGIKRTQLLDQAIELLLEHYSNNDIKSNAKIPLLSEKNIEETDEKLLNYLKKPIISNISTVNFELIENLNYIIERYNSIIKYSSYELRDLDILILESKINDVEELLNSLNHNNLASAEYLKEKLSNSIRLIHKYSPDLKATLDHIVSYINGQYSDIYNLLSSMTLYKNKTIDIKVNYSKQMGLYFYEICELLIESIVVILDREAGSVYIDEDGNSIGDKALKIKDYNISHLIKPEKNTFNNTIITTQGIGRTNRNIKNTSIPMSYKNTSSEISIDHVLEKIESLEHKNEELTKKYRELNIRIDKLQEATDN